MEQYKKANSYARIATRYHFFLEGGLVGDNLKLRFENIFSYDLN